MTGSSRPVLVVCGHREFVVEPGESKETDLGILDIPPDVEPGMTIETHLEEPFTVRQLRGPDLFDHLERTGAPMMPRDIGLVIGHTGISAGDRVLDAGTGTGILAAYLGRLDVRVTTYESQPDFAAVARENMETAGVSDQVDVRTGDILDAVSELEDRFDLLTLDTDDAPDVISTATDLIEPGGYVAAYTPFVESARACTTAAKDADFGDIETFETIQRTMDFDERGSRPSTAGVGHTGYLIFARNTPPQNTHPP